MLAGQAKALALASALMFHQQCLAMIAVSHELDFQAALAQELDNRKRGLPDGGEGGDVKRPRGGSQVCARTALLSAKVAYPVFLPPAITSTWTCTRRARARLFRLAAGAPLIAYFFPSVSIQKGRLQRYPRLRDGPCRWFADYLAEDAVYPASKFRQVFRVPIRMFRERLLPDLEPHLEKSDGCVAGQELTPAYVKILGTLRFLGDSPSLHQCDDQWRAGVSTISAAIKDTLALIVDVYGPEYLAPPTPDTIKRIEFEYAERGFPGCIGALDCNHLPWRMCPTLWQGQFKGKYVLCAATVEFVRVLAQATSLSSQ